MGLSHSLILLIALCFCFQLINSYLNFQVLIFSALVAATCATPIADAPHPVEKLAPRPFAYQYGVKDGDSGPSFDSSESQNAEGVVEGKKTH